MEFRLLGRFEVEADGVDLTPPRRQHRILLALLLLHADEVVATDDCVEALWGERPPETAQTALHGHVAALRKRLGAERIETRPPGYRLLLADEDELDSRRFERVVAAGTDDPLARSEKLGEALALFRGEPLCDFRYEEFAGAEAMRLEELRLAAVEEQVEADLELGRHAEVVPLLERLVADHPLRERLRAQLMLALYGAGRQADALKAFKDARTLLVDELGIEPSPALQHLERQILNHDPELGVPDGFAPERRRTRALVSLPAQATSLIGRGREISEVANVLQRPGVRLVTLTGTGGTGKTRVAIEVAAGLRDVFADGVVFISLAPLQNQNLVLTTAAQALGVRVTGGKTLEEDLRRHLRSRRLLLVFDNFEHVVEAAPSVAGIAASAPDVKLLVTSRAPLRLSAERVYPILPLETPESGDDLERLSQCESVSLFETRAQSVQPGFAVTRANADAIADICRALDGLPLAIELAATRVGGLPPAALQQRLDHRLKLLVGGARDAPERHRTLRATIDWSFDLLTPAEQRLFVRLAAFSGGCTIEAAQQVCGDEDEVVDALTSLTDNGLVRLEGTDEEPRFSMLETIREYALERLEDSGEASGRRRRHADYFLAVAEELEPNLIGTGSHAAWLDRLERDHANFRAALDWFEDSAHSDEALRLAAALWRFWDLRGHLVEGRRRLEIALGGDERPTAARAKALGGAADMALTNGDVAAGGAWAEEALELHRRLGDAWGIAFSLLMFAYAVGQRGDWARAQQLYDESARRFHALSDEHYAGRATRSLAWAYYEAGDLEEARAVNEENIRHARTIDDKLLEGVALTMMADCAVDEDRLEEAATLMKEGLGILRDAGDLLMSVAGVCRTARVLALAGRPQPAALVLSSAAVLLDEIGARPPWLTRITDEALSAIRAQLDETAFAEAWEHGQTLTADQAVGVALDSFG